MTILITGMRKDFSEELDAILAKMEVEYHSVFEVEVRFSLNCPQIFLFSL